MTTSNPRKPLTIAVGTLLTASVTNLFAGDIQDNPFSMSDLSSGYMVAEKETAGKGGEGECGAKKMFKKMDTDGDGEISRMEFMQAHGKMFMKMDKNDDGMLEPDEIKQMKKEKMKKKRENSMEGKCGEGKCGGNK